MRKSNVLMVIVVAVTMCPMVYGYVYSDYTWHTYNGHQYALTMDFGTWEQAGAEAVAVGGHLVTINDADENAWVAEFIKDVYVKGCYNPPVICPSGNLAWIGYRNLGGWGWISGEPVTYTNFLQWYNGIYAYIHGSNHSSSPGKWNNNPTHYQTEGDYCRGVIEISEAMCYLSDKFEDGIIDSNLWVALGRKGGQGAFGTGGWQHSFAEYPNGNDDGYLEARVWGPPSGNTYWGEASVRTTYNFNDGNQWLINFTWETTAVNPYFDCFAVQITDGGFPQTESAHWLWNVPAGTVNLWFTVSNGEEDQPIAPFSKRTWSIAIDPLGIASFYQLPNAEGIPSSQVALDLSREWYLRLVQVDATSAGYPGGDNTFRLYDFSAVCGPVEPDIEVSPLSHDFGDVELGTSRTVIVAISNVGNGDLTVSGIGLETDFAITSAPESAIVVEPNQTEHVEIAYTPSGPGYNSAVLKITSDDPNEPVVEVHLIAAGIEILLPPLEQIANILAFFDASIGDGTLIGDGPGNSAEKRLNALRNMIESSGDLIENELFEEACQQLSDAYRRMDGKPKPPDFVTGEAVTGLATMIQELMKTLGC